MREIVVNGEALKSVLDFRLYVELELIALAQMVVKILLCQGLLCLFDSPSGTKDYLTK
jgi:hypothetical protein